MKNKSKLPPLWSLPTMLTQVPRMLWAQYRGDYYGAMKVGRQLLGSTKIKTRAFKGYTPTVNDVFVCTFAKSGTYWMLQMMTQIAGRGAAEFDHIHDIVPWPEAPMPGIARLSEPTWQDTPSQRRAIKTHVESRFIPYNKDAKYVIVIRDPKDVLISSFHFVDSVIPGASSIGLDAWTEIFISGETPHGIWAEHVAGFWPWRQRDNVMVVTYAAMKRDLEKVAYEVAELMGVELNEAEMALVVEKSSFAYMKAIETKFEPPAPTARENSIELIRNGEKGEAFERLAPEQIAKIDREMQSKLQELGSDFPYYDYFG